ncbi:MAG: triose-phosphate isomerase [Gemmataceae bacterium]|nr:triose-phosphate isomerase [Gemmataceae bacterium]
MPRAKFIAGNWKMYTTLEQARQLAQRVAQGVDSVLAQKVRVAVCPPFPWLLPVAEVLRGSAVALGAQDCHYEREGAYTGQVSPYMLREAGCQYVIIGHSERRHGLGESDEFLNKKLHGALRAGLHVIFCIGELLTEREANQTEQVLQRQLLGGLAGLTAEQLQQVTIAYEPVWAIGTGRVATEEQAEHAHAFVRRTIAELFGSNAAENVLIQYGGSVKPENAAGLLKQPDVDGCLVGGASLNAEAFLAILRTCL